MKFSERLFCPSIRLFFFHLGRRISGCEWCRLAFSHQRTRKDGRKMSDSESSESEDEITPLNEEIETVHPPDVALSSSEDRAALPSHQNQVALRSQEQQVALPSNQGQLAGPSESEVVITGGNFKKINLGPQTDKRKQVNKAYNYSNAKFTEHHHHYYGSAEESRESTPGTSGVRRKVRPKRSATEKTGRGQVTGLVDSEDYVQISEDIFMCRNKPLKKSAKVYKGYQLHASGHRRPLAIKVISPCEDANVREVELLLKLSHPNVVQIFHSKEHEGVACRELCIAMELCSSQNLQDYLNEKREKNEPLDFHKTMSLSKQLIRGMQHIHRNRVAHRDVKPQNVLFSRDMEQIKVSDFGISKEIRPGRSSTKRTRYAEGTEGYRSPESYLSDVISMSADIYSLAITLHILWSNGCHPFGLDPDLWIYNIKKNRGRDFSTLLFPEEMATKREEFVDLLDQMLQFDPKLRPTIDQVLKHPFFSNTETLEGSATNDASLETEVAQELQTTERTFSTIEETFPKQVASRPTVIQPQQQQEPTSSQLFTSTQPRMPVQQNQDYSLMGSYNSLPHHPAAAAAYDTQPRDYLPSIFPQPQTTIDTQSVASRSSVSIPAPAAGPSNSGELTFSAPSHIDQSSIQSTGRNDWEMSQQASNQSGQFDGDTSLSFGPGVLAQNPTASHSVSSQDYSLMGSYNSLPHHPTAAAAYDTQLRNYQPSIFPQPQTTIDTQTVASRSSISIPATAAGPSNSGELMFLSPPHIDQSSIEHIWRNDREMSQQASNQPGHFDGGTSLPFTAGALAQNPTTTSLGAISWNAELDAAVEEPSHKECEKAEALIRDSKFEEAALILEDLPPSQRQQLLLIDCYFQLGRGSQLIKFIETMQMLMTQDPRPDADDVYNLGDKNFESQAYIRALIYLSCASKLYKLDHTSNPNHAMYMVCKCSSRCYEVIRDMAEQGGRMRELANDFEIYVITQILADYRSIRIGDPDIQIEYECCCLNRIGICYRATKQHQKSIENYKLGIEIMKRHFGEKASSFCILGKMIHNLGLVEFDLGNYIEAEKCFSEALKTVELAEDFSDEETKKKLIQQWNDNMLENSWEKLLIVRNSNVFR